MNNRITDELQSFLKDYAAEPSPRDFAIAQHFYNLALADVKKETEKTIRALKKHNPNPLGTITECLAASEITALETVIDFIDNQKQ